MFWCPDLVVVFPLIYVLTVSTAVITAKVGTDFCSQPLFIYR